MTAHLEQDKLLFAAELNLTKYLPKPISRLKLKEALKEAASQYKELDFANSTISLSEDFIWNNNTKKLSRNKEDIKLTKHEILLLELLTSKKNSIFSNDEISLYLWNDVSDLEYSATKLKDIIKRLRKKLPKDTISNIYGAGYKLNN